MTDVEPFEMTAPNRIARAIGRALGTKQREQAATDAVITDMREQLAAKDAEFKALARAFAAACKELGGLRAEVAQARAYQQQIGP